MEVLPIDDLDQVAGGFLPLAILGAMLLNLDIVKSAVTGAVDGIMDGFRGIPPNPDY